MQIDAAPGEVIDKIAILGVKEERITDPVKLQNIKNELAALQAPFSVLLEWVAHHTARHTTLRFTDLVAELREVNAKIWDIEDKIRRLEKAQDFSDEFIQTARSVYFTNDRRAAIKRELNQIFNTDIAEEKSYEQYT
jgi:hypothetical protein